MILFTIISLMVQLFLLIFIITNVIFLVRTVRYQKKWDKEKAMRVRIDPKITRAELCEQYVMFCKRNDCNVEF